MAKLVIFHRAVALWLGFGFGPDPDCPGQAGFNKTKHSQNRAKKHDKRRDTGTDTQTYIQTNTSIYKYRCFFCVLFQLNRKGFP